MQGRQRRFRMGLVLSGVLALGTGLAPTAAAAAGPPAPAPVARPGAAVLATMNSLSRTLASHGATNPGAITGMVRDTAGAPLAGACVTARGPSGAAIGVAHSDGRFLISGLKPGVYSLSYRDCATPGHYFGQPLSGTGAPAAQQVLVSPGRVTPLRSVNLIAASPALRFAPLSRAPHAAGPLGTISGTVTDRAGKPLTGICALAVVTLRGAEFGELTSTGGKGRYSLPGLPAGRYTVGFLAQCGNRGNYAPQWWKHTSKFSRATKIHITGGRVVTGIGAALGPGAEIAGTVRLRNKFGRPLGGICVFAQPKGGQNIFAPMLTATNGHGAYLVKSLATGTYRIGFEPGCRNNGNFLPASYGHPVRATGGKVTKGIDGFLQPGGQITGVVTDSHGNAIRGICVDAGAFSSGGSATTHADGSYTIRQLPTGHYTVSFAGGCGAPGSLAPQWYRNHSNDTAADPVAVVAGQATAGINAVMQPGATIEGQVTHTSGKPIAGVCVAALTPLLAQIGFPLTATETASDGSYQLRDLSPGQYEVAFFPGCNFFGNDALEWFRSSPGGGSASLVSAAAGTPATGIDGVMRPAGGISGVVTSAATGHHLPNVCVTATNVANGAVQGSITDRGSYQVNGLLPGSYQVEFSPCLGQDYADQWYRLRASPSAATPVTVTARQVTTGIDGALTSAGSISGLVRSSVTHQPRANVCLLAFDPGTGSYGLGLSGKNGRFRIGPLDTGSYWVEYALCIQGNSDLGAQILPSRVQVTAPHAVTGVGITIRPGGAISGEARGGLSSPHPAAGVCVQVLPRTGNGAGGFAFTSRNGGYIARGLAPGSYDVYFFADDCGFLPAALAPQWYDNQPTQATATPVTVTADVTRTGIDTTMPRKSTIGGTVTGPGNTPLSGICVTAVADQAGATPVVAVTANGSYSIIGLDPGRYRVEFDSGCGASTGYITQWYSGASSEGAATVITVPAQASVPGIDATMSPAP